VAGPGAVKGEVKGIMEAWRVTLKQWMLILELEGHPGAVELWRLNFESCI
jgi:hypothetical protein